MKCYPHSPSSRNFVCVLAKLDLVLSAVYFFRCVFCLVCILSGVCLAGCILAERSPPVGLNYGNAGLGWRSREAPVGFKSGPSRATPRYIHTPVNSGIQQRWSGTCLGNTGLVHWSRTSVIIMYVPKIVQPQVAYRQGGVLGKCFTIQVVNRLTVL